MNLELVKFNQLIVSLLKIECPFLVFKNYFFLRNSVLFCFVMIVMGKADLVKLF
jgi:hypothetical protein